MTTFDVAAFISRLNAAGFAISADPNGELVIRQDVHHNGNWSPAGGLGPDLGAELEQHQAEIFETLRRQ